MIDSFKALTPYAADARDYRIFLHELAGAVSGDRGTSFWLGEYGADEIATAPEFAVADSVIASARDCRGAVRARAGGAESCAEASTRRGSTDIGLTEDGLDVFPRLADERDDPGYTVGDERVTTGIPRLDKMLDGGYWAGSATLVAGPSGIGKTLMGLQFIVARARSIGEPGIMATPAGEPLAARARRCARSPGPGGRRSRSLPLAGRPLRREWIYGCSRRRAHRRQAGADRQPRPIFRFAAGDAARFREYMYSLTQRFSRAGISVLMTSELPDLFTITRLSEYGVSHLSDNVILLQYIRDGSRIRRALTVLKSRATGTLPRGARVHDRRLRGIALGDTIDSRPSAAIT